MTNPTVSILIPCFNAEKFIAKTLESALSQTARGIEIIVVNDGSVDRSLETVRRFEPRGVKIISQENSGQCSALNTAFAAARGNYIQYLDADDVLDPRKIEIQLSRLKEADASAMATCAWARFQTDTSDARFAVQGIWQDLDPVEWLIDSWNGGGMMHVAAWLIPRKIVEAAGPWVETLRWAYCLDADFFTRALLASSRCLFCADARSYYRSVRGSQASIRTRQSMVGSLRCMVRTGEALLRAENNARTRTAYANNLQRFVHLAYPACPDLVSMAEKRIRILGGSTIVFEAGPVTQVTAKYLGWKSAKRIRGRIAALETCFVRRLD